MKSGLIENKINWNCSVYCDNHFRFLHEDEIQTITLLKLINYSISMHVFSHHYPTTSFLKSWLVVQNLRIGFSRMLISSKLFVRLVSRRIVRMESAEKNRLQLAFFLCVLNSRSFSALFIWRFFLTSVRQKASKIWTSWLIHRCFFQGDFIRGAGLLLCAQSIRPYSHMYAARHQ